MEQLSMRRPVVLICLAFMVGLIVQPLRPVHAAFLVGIVVVALGVVPGLLRVGGPRAGVPALLVAVTALGAIRADLSRHVVDYHTRAAMRAQYIGAEFLVGRVVDSRRSRQGNLRIDLADTTARKGQEALLLPGRVRLSCSGEAAVPRQFVYGDWIRVSGWISPVGRAALPHQQDTVDFLAADGVSAQVWVREATAIELLRRRSIPLLEWPVYSSRRIRDRALAAIDQTLPPVSGGLLQAMLLAERDAVPPDLMHAFRRTGLAHLLALSGLHVSLLVGCVFGTLRLLRIRRKLRAMLSLLFVLFFLTMVGWQAPIVRATVLGVCLMLGSILERKTDGLNLLALSALLQVLIQPLELYQLSFQLSHLIVFYLLLAHIASQPILTGIRRTWLRWPAVGILASFIASMASAPLIGNAFGFISMIQVVANLPAVPLAGLVVFLGLFFCTAVVLFPPLGPLLAPLMMVPLWMLEHVTRLFAHAPVFAVGRSSNAALALLYALLAVALTPWNRLPPLLPARPARKVLVLLLLLLVYVCVDLVSILPKPLRVQFLALGQSDCVLVRCPHGETILVDGGRPTASLAHRSLLVDLLHRERVRRVDVMLNTHPQADHIGDLDRVVRAGIPVGLAVVNPDPGGGEHAQAFRRALADAQVRVATAHAGMELRGIRDVRLEILYPAPNLTAFSAGPGDPNEWSVVARLVYRQFELLLTGDIGSEAELALLRRGVELDSDVLKVPHHGSRRSSTPAFLRRVDPEVAIVQVGRNPYGHPSPETLHRLRQAGACVFTTQRHGTVELVTDGETYTVTAARSDTLVRGSAYRDP